jgi:hypothetical protein
MSDKRDGSEWALMLHGLFALFYKNAGVKPLIDDNTTCAKCPKV